MSFDLDTIHDNIDRAMLYKIDLSVLPMDTMVSTEYYWALGNRKLNEILSLELQNVKVIIFVWDVSLFVGEKN